MYISKIIKNYKLEKTKVAQIYGIFCLNLS